MNLAPYRRVLTIPGVKSLLIGGFLARVPYAAQSLALTLFVRFGLQEGYFQSGLVGALFVIGAAIGSTVHGKVADRYGVRPVLAFTSIGAAVFWLSVGMMSYPMLVVIAPLAGVLNLPVFVVIRQPLAALVPSPHRRTAYALDSTLVEVAFMIGPAVATGMAALAVPVVTPIAIGIWTPLAGALLWWLNPRTRSDEELTETAPRLPFRQWCDGRLIAMLIAGVGATVALGGSDVAIVSLLEHSGQIGQGWIVLMVWALASMAGGFTFGAMRREVSPLALLGVLGVLTFPLGLLDAWWLLALALVIPGVLTAPTIASSVDKVSQLVPASVRGVAMGMHGSAITIGTAVGAPLVGWTVDNIGVRWGFAAAGAGAVAAAIAAFVLWRTSSAAARSQPRPPAEAVAGTEATDAV